MSDDATRAHTESPRAGCGRNEGANGFGSSLATPSSQESSPLGVVVQSTNCGQVQPGMAITVSGAGTGFDADQSLLGQSEMFGFDVDAASLDLDFGFDPSAELDPLMEYFMAGTLDPSYPTLPTPPAVISGEFHPR